MAEDKQNQIQIGQEVHIPKSPFPTTSSQQQQWNTDLCSTQSIMLEQPIEFVGKVWEAEWKISLFNIFFTTFADLGVLKRVRIACIIEQYNQMGEKIFLSGRKNVRCLSTFFIHCQDSCRNGLPKPGCYSLLSA